MNGLSITDDGIAGMCATASVTALTALTMDEIDRDLTHSLLLIATLGAYAIPGADGVGVSVLAQNGLRPSMAFSAEFVRAVDVIQHGFGQGPSLTAAAENRTAHSTNLAEDGQWPRFGGRVARLGVHSGLSLPLRSGRLGGRVIGTLDVYAHAENAFGPRERALGEQFAIPAAISVQNAIAPARRSGSSVHLATALTDQAMIDRAVGALMDRRGCSEALAFHELRALAQDLGATLIEMADSIVDERLYRIA